MSPSAYFLIAAVADFTAVVVHGVIGHRVLMSPLGRERLFPTQAFGDEVMTWRVFAVSWHLVTAAFACSGIALLLLALGQLHGTSLPLFISAMHAAFLLVGLTIVGRPSTLRRPIPIAFVLCMATACIAAWLGARSMVVV